MHNMGDYNKLEHNPTSKLSDLFTSESMTQSEDESSIATDVAASTDASPEYTSNPPSGEATPYDVMSPWNPAASPFAKSPWTHHPLVSDEADTTSTGLIGSLVREEGHVYSLAASGDLLFTGSDSKNIRVWKGNREFAGFKSGSGLVKAIVVAGGKIFTGHQDGKIRIWKVSSKDPSLYKRVGTLPKLKDYLKSSVNPSNYVRVRRNKNALWLRHFDAVSCLSYDEAAGILYSGSWDKTVKVWRLSDSKCLESIKAHDDAVNAVAAAGFDGLLFTGSADGTVKVWRREMVSRGRGGAATKHVLVQNLFRQECAVTALAVAPTARVVYCGCSDGVVHYWLHHQKDRRLVYGGALRGHRMAVLCLAVAGNLVASGSADKTVCVWRRDDATDAVGENCDHTRVAVLTGHEGPIKCLSIEEADHDGGPSGQRYVLYSGSLDNSVKIWRVLDSDVDRGSDDKMVNGSHVPMAGNGFQRSPLHVRGSNRVSGQFGGRTGRGPLVQDVRG